jgi:hypothetical protein
VVDIEKLGVERREEINVMRKTELVERKTATMLAGVYLQAEQEIREAYNLLETAKQRLCGAFVETGYYFNPNQRENSEVGEKGATIAMRQIHKHAWRRIIDRMGIRQLLSVDRREKLDEQLSTGKGLPEVSETAILEMLEATAGNIEKYMEEAALEVFEYLRPCNSKLKTNSEFEIGKRVILQWAVEPEYFGNGFRIRHHRDSMFTALDNVFQGLAGQGVVKTHHGPLYNAVQESKDGTGQTEYFKFRACKNGNLHLEFLRPDLVTRLNQIAGGARLRQGI